ncbi:MAG: nitroreductase [Candidatus Lokiarchaeota archaeon]|nr:nitroreductase [Candidatus Lokiarchaeota archaeon]
MDFYEVIKNRRSYRFYESKMPEKEKVEKILNAARLAPTWANFQGVNYIIVQDSDTVNKIWKAIGQRNKFETAPMFIVGIISPSDSGKNMNGEKYYGVDFGICFEHLILAATAEGLGSCWIGWFDEEKIKEILEIPDKYKVMGLTPLGYPNKKKGTIKERKPLDELVHREQF